MKVCIITGSAGLIGSEAVKLFAKKFDKVIGIDNNQRAKLFGKEASTWPTAIDLIEDYSNYIHNSVDIRDEIAIHKIFSEHKSAIKLIIHTAAQPSHDWAAKEPKTDFTINANGTLTLLEATRLHCPEAVFIFTSTNKVYGDTPNNLPLVELNTRYELHADHKFYYGIDETMSIDQSKHSLFGVSKLSADLMVQEYGRYFGMNTGVFRGGCLTGPNHAGTQMHGFLSYLMKCAVSGQKYEINGYKGKQVRDNIHSYDLVNMFHHFYQNPRQGEVYNAGGGRHSNCSMNEAIELCQEIAGKSMNVEYFETPRIGDHIWWISNISKFREHYPEWCYHYTLKDTLRQMHKSLTIKK